jgi:cold shock CspA family protein
VLRPDLSIHSLYNGWWFVGRPSVEELQHDLRAIMEARADYRYAAYGTPEVRQVRIPQQEWANGAPPLGATGLPVRRGTVCWFDTAAGMGEITPDEGGEAAFFHFTAIPGQGYRTIRAGTAGAFEQIATPAGPTARNIQPVAG